MLITLRVDEEKKTEFQKIADRHNKGNMAEMIRMAVQSYAVVMDEDYASRRMKELEAEAEILRRELAEIDNS